MNLKTIKALFGLLNAVHQQVDNIAWQAGEITHLFDTFRDYRKILKWHSVETNFLSNRIVFPVDKFKRFTVIQNVDDTQYTDSDLKDARVIVTGNRYYL